MVLCVEHDYGLSIAGDKSLMVASRTHSTLSGQCREWPHNHSSLSFLFVTTIPPSGSYEDVELMNQLFRSSKGRNLAWNSTPVPPLLQAKEGVFYGSIQICRQRAWSTGTLAHCSGPSFSCQVFSLRSPLYHNLGTPTSLGFT